MRPRQTPVEEAHLWLMMVKILKYSDFLKKSVF